MTQYAEAIIELDAARRRVEQSIQDADGAVSLMLRRLNSAWGSIPEDCFQNFREQVQKALSLSAELRDFRAYLQEPRAWSPAKEDA